MTGAAESLPGATWLGGGRCRFRVWAPDNEEVTLHLLEPEERRIPMEPGPRGYHQTLVEGVSERTLYLYGLSGGVERPDPASRHQPRGVHGPSRVVNPSFAWDDEAFRAPRTSDLVLYEIHVGTFTREGTFDAVVEHLDDLRELGITALEIMPVAQFPGSRNWGYDGASPWAVQNSYGGPEGLRRLVQACHRKGLAVHLDVVYNHLGPEGNYLAAFGPYFTQAYRTPWGPAVNFDGPGSDEVRAFFLGNALHWIREHHVDGLRLDALHAIIDRSAKPFLEELAEAVDEESERTGRTLLVVGEDNRNDPRLAMSRDQGGIGLHGLWSDDFHHALHTLITEESQGYYQDFGELADLERAFSHRFVYDGRYSPFRGHRYGRPAQDLPSDRFVVFVQNHDQIGNRLRGDRLSALVRLRTLVRPEALRLAAMAVILSPYVPLLFMGEEYGELAPFPYFTSHSDPRLAEAVREGRKEEFAGFGWEEDAPDPQDEGTFRSACLQRALKDKPGHRGLLALHRRLLSLRREHPALGSRRAEDLETIRQERDRVLVVKRRQGPVEGALVFRFASGNEPVSLPLGPGRWRRVLDTQEERWEGPGTLVPEVVESGGMVTLDLGPWSGLFLERG